MPKVSVIMASYNGARYLAETLKALQAQTLSDFEIVIVDDGSAAPTLEMLATFTAADPRIHVHHAAHAGLVATVNAAISRARGGYVARIDHDDICRPHRLERQAAYLDANPTCVAVGCDIDFIDGDGRIYKAGKSHARHDPHAPLAFPPHPNFLPGPTLMARATALQAIDGYRAACFAAEDRDISWRLGALGPTYRLRERLVLWRNHGAGTTAQKHLTQMASHAVGDLSAVARALGLDDSAIIADVVVGGDYLPIIARYKALLGHRYPVDTYWYYFLMRYRVWQLSGVPSEDALLKIVRAHCNENPADWRRWKLRRRARLFERRDRNATLVPQST